MEQEMKRTLDRQVQEKGIAGKLQKYADGLETAQISQEYINFQKAEHKAKLDQERKVAHNLKLLNSQIIEKKAGSQSPFKHPLGMKREQL